MITITFEDAVNALPKGTDLGARPWTTRAGVTMCWRSMTYEHLINSADMLQRKAVEFEQKALDTLETGYRVIGGMRGEVAQMYAESSVDAEYDDLLESSRIYNLRSVLMRGYAEQRKKENADARRS